MTDQQLHWLSLVESHLHFCKESIREEKPFDAEDYADLALEYLGYVVKGVNNDAIKRQRISRGRVSRRP